MGTGAGTATKGDKVQAALVFQHDKEERSKAERAANEKVAKGGQADILSIHDIAEGGRKNHFCASCGMGMGEVKTATGMVLKCGGCGKMEAGKNQTGGGFSGGFGGSGGFEEIGKVIQGADDGNHSRQGSKQHHHSRSGSKHSQHHSEGDTGSRSASKNHLGIPEVHETRAASKNDTRAASKNSAAGSSGAPSTRAGSKQEMVRQPSKQELAQEMSRQPSKQSSNKELHDMEAGFSTCNLCHHRMVLDSSHRGNVCDIKGPLCKRKTSVRCGHGCDFDACMSCINWQRANAVNQQVQNKTDKENEAASKIEAAEAKKEARKAALFKHTVVDGVDPERDPMGGFLPGDKVVFEAMDSAVDIEVAEEFGIGVVKGPGKVHGVIMCMFDKHQPGHAFNLKADGMRKINAMEESSIKQRGCIASSSQKRK